MANNARYDVTYRDGEPMLDYHFCREWDGDKGCYGTNPDHGFTFEEAREVAAAHYRQEVERWSKMTEEEWEAAGGFW